MARDHVNKRIFQIIILNIEIVQQKFTYGKFLKDRLEHKHVLCDQQLYFDCCSRCIILRNVLTSILIPENRIVVKLLHYTYNTYCRKWK